MWWLLSMCPLPLAVLVLPLCSTSQTQTYLVSASSIYLPMDGAMSCSCSSHGRHQSCGFCFLATRGVIGRKTSQSTPTNSWLRNMHQIFTCPRVKHKSSALDHSIKPCPGFATVPIHSQNGIFFTLIMPNVFQNMEQKRSIFPLFWKSFSPFSHENFHLFILKTTSSSRSCWW